MAQSDTPTYITPLRTDSQDSVNRDPRERRGHVRYPPSLHLYIHLSHPHPFICISANLHVLTAYLVALDSTPFGPLHLRHAVRYLVASGHGTAILK
jgi:hypothetical protein